MMWRQMLRNPAGSFLINVLAAMACMPVAGWAQKADVYPSRPVTIVHPYPPGGSTDPEVRLYAQKLNENLGVPFLVDARPGAGTTIGTAAVSKAAPDGYTLVTLSPSFTIAPLIYRNLPYDAEKDIAPVSLMSKRASLVMVHAGLPIRTVPEYVAYVKANPGKFNFGTSSVGGVTHLGVVWFLNATNTNVDIVPYKGGGPMYVDLTAGRVHAAIVAAITGVPFMKSGKLRAIAVTSTERMKILPDIPTAAEQGATGYDYSFWIGFGAPGGTPAVIVNRMSSELVKVSKDPLITQKLASEANNSVGSTPEQFRQHISAEISRWRKVVADTGIKLEE